MRTLLRLLVPLLPVALDAAEFDAAAAANAAGLNIYRQLAAAAPGTNLIISPYSMQTALALAHAGAEGQTRAQMSAALGLPDDNSAAQRGLATLRNALDTAAAQGSKLAAVRDRGAQVSTMRDGKRVELVDHAPVAAIEWRVANRLFAQQNYRIRASFSALMRDGYSAPLETLDFKHHAERERGTINQWVSDQTHGRIRDLLPAGGVRGDTRLILVNALYLKAPWDVPFAKSLTQARPFHISPSVARNVPTMLRGGQLGYAHENGVTVVALDYLGRGLQCLILLPDEDREVDAVAAQLTAADFARWAKLGERDQVKRLTLFLPKFRVEGATMSLATALRRIGIKSAFDEPVGSANFDRIAPGKPDDYLCISEVFHRTFVALDEEGTEAAAATAVLMAVGAVVNPEKPLEVRVDRPFLFAIQHRATGLCLFLGRIADPR